MIFSSFSILISSSGELCWYRVKETSHPRYHIRPLPFEAILNSKDVYASYFKPRTKHEWHTEVRKKRAMNI